MTLFSRCELCLCRILFWLLFGCTVVPAPAQGGAGSSPIEALSVERLASLPSLSGTPPLSPVWSPDSTAVAFLWNDQGMPFRDVWTFSPKEGLKRLTTLGDSGSAPSGEGGAETAVDEYAKLRQETSWRMRPGVREVIWSPDSRSLLLLFEDRLYSIDSGGSAIKALPLPPAARRRLAFSPGGEYVSWLQQGDLWLWNRQSGERVRATRVGRPPHGKNPGGRFFRPDAGYSDYRWSPDGRFIALPYEDRSRVQEVLIPDFLGEETAVIPVRRDYPGDNDQVRRVEIYSVGDARATIVELPQPTDRRIHQFLWSPDSTRLLIDQSSEDVKDRWIYEVSAERVAARQVWHDHRETRTTALWNSTWSGNSEAILFVSDKDGRHHLYRLELSDLKVRQLTSGEWSVVGFSGASPLSRPGPQGFLYFLSTRKSPYERQVERTSEEGGSVEQVTALEGSHDFAAAPDGVKLAVLHSGDTRPTELYWQDGREGDEHRITRSPLPEFYRQRWAVPRYVTFPSRSDGVLLHGRILEPPGLDRDLRYPVILGPVYSNTARNRWVDHQEWRGLYDTFQQFLVVQKGFIVLQVDVRGSVGHGRPFREKLLGDFGGIDVEDLHSGVEYLATLPYVDRDRIGIWGSSYGGLMTLMSLFKKPGLYRAGVAGAPATNVWHATTGEVRVTGRPAAFPEVFRNSSAVSYGRDLQDPLLILHGVRDDIVQFKDSMVLVEKLMMLGKEFDLAVAPGSVHGWTEQDYVARYMLKKVVRHFERHLLQSSSENRGELQR